MAEPWQQARGRVPQAAVIPLKPGHSDAVVAANYKELRASGYEHKQALAIALDEARKSRKKKTVKK